MLVSTSSSAVVSKIAIFLIAIFVVNTWTTAQNSTNSTPVAVPDGDAQVQESAERARIAQQTAAAQASFERAKEACYQKFAVNACVADAQAKQREVLANLKRQEVALNDLARKRLAMAQLQKTQDKNSPQRQAEIAAQRAAALASTAERNARSDQKRADKKVATQPAQQRGPAKQARQAQPAKTAVSKAPRSPADAASAKAQYDKKQLEAAQYKAKVQAQQQGAKPAAGLPVPAN
jgi:colicin import membrane protein